MSNHRTQFQQLLRELFDFDVADLDYGIYRILNHKRQIIERFITEDLPQAIAEELQQGALAEQTQATKDLEAARKKVLEALGEEFYLYWANNDQYYVKSGDYFTDYTWKAPNGVTVHFKLQAADVEQNNVKGEMRFFLPRMDEIAREENPPLPAGEGPGVRADTSSIAAPRERGARQWSSGARPRVGLRSTTNATALCRGDKLTDGTGDVLVNGDSFIPGAQAQDSLFKARMFASMEG